MRPGQQFAFWSVLTHLNSTNSDFLQLKEVFSSLVLCMIKTSKHRHTGDMRLFIKTAAEHIWPITDRLSLSAVLLPNIAFFSQNSFSVTDASRLLGIHIYTIPTEEIQMQLVLKFVASDYCDGGGRHVRDRLSPSSRSQSWSRSPPCPPGGFCSWSTASCLGCCTCTRAWNRWRLQRKEGGDKNQTMRGAAGR